MTDLSQIAEQEWHEAQRRAEVVRPLAESKRCSRLKAPIETDPKALNDGDELIDVKFIDEK